MSYNLIARYNDPATDTPKSIILTRVIPGLTHSAVLAENHIIEFPNGVQVEIEYIKHKWRPYSDDISPVSTAYGRIHEQMVRGQELDMLAYGFTEVEDG